MPLFELDAPEPAIAEADLFAPTFNRALVSIMDELLAMDERRVLAINVDLSATTTLVIGAARDLRALRAEMVRKFGEEEASAVDRLELLARAVAQAQARHTVAESEDDLPRLAAAVADERAALLAEVASLAARKRLSRSALGRVRGEHTVIADEVPPRRRDDCGQARDEIERLAHDGDPFGLAIDQITPAAYKAARGRRPPPRRHESSASSSRLR